MGLLRFLLNGRVVKIVLIVIGIALMADLFAWIVGFLVDLGTLPQSIPLTIAFVGSALLTMKTQKPYSLPSFAKFLGLALAPAIMAFNISALVQLPSTFDFLFKLAILLVPYVMYALYRKRLPSWRKDVFYKDVSRRRSKLSRRSLIPKGLEEGHIVYGAGKKGLRVIKFAELGEYLHLDKPLSVATTSPEDNRIAAHVIVDTARLGFEISYELHYRNGDARAFIACLCEGRSYRECRAKVDESSRALVERMSISNPRTYNPKPVVNNNSAKRALMMPFFTTLEMLGKIETDEKDLKVFEPATYREELKLRAISLDCFGEGEPIDNNHIGELIQAAASRKPRHDFTYIVHIKPVAFGRPKKEQSEAQLIYRSAIGHIADEVDSEITAGKTNSKNLFRRRRDSAIQANTSMDLAKKKIAQLREAQLSGYFETSVTLIGEPSIESLVRSIQRSLLQETGSSPSVRCVPPVLTQNLVRREMTTHASRLSGRELASLIVFPYKARSGHANGSKPSAKNSVTMLLESLPVS